MDMLADKRPMEANVLTLKFTSADAALEGPFLRDFNEASRLQVRVALFLAIILIAVFSVLDYLILPSLKYIAWFIRFAVLCPAIGLGIALTYHAKAPKLFPWIQIVLCNIVGAGFMGMIVTSPAPANYLYYGGLVLVLMYGYGFVRLRFIWASLSGWLLVIVYEIVAWGFTGTDRGILLSNTFFLVTANCIGMAGCYTIERNQRKGFFLERQLREERQNVVAANTMLEQRVIDRTAELALANQTLERQIGERKLLEEQTRQAQKMESIGLLAGGVAHDFNNILTIILGNAQLLAMRELPADKLSHHVNAITTSANRGTQLVAKLLTFARKTETNYGPVNVNDVAREIVGLLGETFPKNIAIVSRLSDTLPFINADGGHIHQVLMNICINARDAMPSGGTLTMTTAVAAGDRVRALFPKALALHYVMIEMADTGFGMDELTQSKIFEPFFTTKETGKGTGLGLAVVYGIVENHHGFIRVQSALEKGTVFSVFLPVSTEYDCAPEAVLSQQKFIKGNGQTVLVIDDEPLILEFMADLLGQQGYRVLTAESGEKGIDLFREKKNRVAVVLSDKDMPLMDGEKVYQALKSISPNVKFILLTGLILGEEKKRLIKTGMLDILHKPVEPKDLLSAIEKNVTG